MQISVLLKNCKRYIQQYPLLSSLLASVVILLTFYSYRWGLNYLNPTYINWVIEDTELANGFFSFGNYRNQEWTFPIGKIQSYFYPIGTNLFTTDLPIMALLFKPFSNILPEPFQYLGIWYILCHILQAWFSILLCDRLCIKGVNRILVVVFLLFTPVMMFRYMHPSLFCQWMIIAGLWIYLLNPEKTPVSKILLYQFCLFIISGLVFAYMWAMVFGFSVALFWRLWLIDKKISFGKALAHFSLHLIVMVVLWFAIGLITIDGVPNYEMEGWGAFSFNLNGFWNPMAKAYIMPEQPYYYPQYEGFAYLGAGVIFLLVAVLCILLLKRLMNKSSNAKSVLTLGETNLLPLYFFFFVSIIFSLSNTVRFNNTVILEYPLPDFLSSVINSFRSSGRFIWPVYYFIIAAVFYLFYRLTIKPWIKTTAVVACLIIQIYDIQYFLKPVTISYEKYTPPIHPVWEELITSFDHVAFVPGFRRSYLTTDDYRYFAYYTTLHQKTINAGYPARFDATAVSKEISKQWIAISENGLDNNTLYISFEPYLNRLVIPIAADEAFCFYIDGYLAIFKKTPHTKIVAARLRSIVPDKRSEILRATQLTPLEESKNSFQPAVGKSSFYETDATDGHFFFKGWAYREESTDPQHDTVYLVLESNRTKKRWISQPSYKFGTSDVATFFNNPALDQAGFGISILSKELQNDSYKVGLLFRNSSTPQSILWIDQTLNIDRPVTPKLTSQQPSNENGVRYDINVFDNQETIIKIESWAFPMSGYCSSCKSYFTLRSNTETYIAETNFVPRKDVAIYFNDSTLVNSGHYIRINKKPLKPGNYRVGFLFYDSLRKISHFSETDKTFEIIGSTLTKLQILRSPIINKGEVKFDINVFNDGEESTYIESWAFPDNRKLQGCKTYFTLNSHTNTYFGEANFYQRPDVVSFFSDSSLLKSGWSISMDKRSLKPGAYNLGILLADSSKNMFYFSQTDKIIKVGGVSIVSELTSIPTGKDSVRAFIDIVEDRNELYHLEGWGFIHPLSSNYTRNYIALKSKHYFYLVEPIMVPRPDLQVYFNLPYSAENAGFKADIRKTDLQPGSYQICVIVKNLKSNTETISCLDTYITIE